MMVDPLADMLTRIRNAVRVERPFVDIPASKLKEGVAEVMKKEGYLVDYEIGTLETDEQGIETIKPLDNPAVAKAILRAYLNYGPQGEKVIQSIKRISKPSCRRYSSYKTLKPVLDGLGISILSTSQGVMSDREARRKKLGGEILCEVY